ncbi:GNAT family N-acetyltransferase [Paraherbaspirillum soli]|uniref:GNAT family N-acetyltransferase n=1 Tax=Paraherbaspirillum soli TaxID=631222 RepID=A0ABW0MC63_9BURK
MGDINRCDGTFLVEHELVLKFDGKQLAYDVISVTPYEKSYLADDPEPDDGDEPADAVFLAYVEDRLAGQIELSRHWNGYAHIDNIVVDRQSRKLGVGRALVLRAIEWAQQEQLAGVMLETQSNNVAACRLYASCGFALKGFDQDLYRGLKRDTREVALFWYWHPPG